MNNIRNLFISLASIGTAVAVLGCGGTDSMDSHHLSDSAASGKSAAKAAGNDGHDHGADASGSHAHSTRLVFNSQPSELPAGTPATWSLKIVDDATGKPVEKFTITHEKLLHLIVVSADLSWFNHIHPEYKGNGEFTITTTLPREGTYRLFADYTPEGGSQEVPQQEITTGGAQPTPTMVLPVVDTLGDDGWMVKRVTATPEGLPDLPGGTEYEVALMPMPGKLVAGKDVMLHFQVRDRSGKPIKDLEPYLGATGHGVILSSDGKVFLHTHPMEGEMEGMDHGAMNHGQGGGSSAKEAGHPAPKSGGPDVMFHTNFPAPGLYKAWGQFQHKGKIIAAAFVVKVEPS